MQFDGWRLVVARPSISGRPRRRLTVLGRPMNGITAISSGVVSRGRYTRRRRRGGVARSRHRFFALR